jgi:iron complex outermembrane receptor protein
MKSLINPGTAWMQLLLASDRRSNPAGAIFDLQMEHLTGFYENQVDDYTQDHFQWHWNEKIR